MPTTPFGCGMTRFEPVAKSDRDVAALRLHPLAQLLARVADAVDAGEELDHHRLLDGAVAEVGVDRVGDRVGVVDQDALELVQVLAALLEGRVRMAQIRLALQREDALRLVLDRVDPPELCGLGHGAILAQSRADRGKAGFRRPAPGGERVGQDAPPGLPDPVATPIFPAKNRIASLRSRLASASGGSRFTGAHTPQ